MILFKSIFRAALLDGSKTTTLRVWNRRLVEPGTTVKTNLGISLWIEAVEDIALTSIDDAIARADGFESAETLITCLREIYPMLPSLLTLIRFQIID